MEDRLKAENPVLSATRANIVGDYFKYGESNDPEMRKKAPKLNGGYRTKRVGTLIPIIER